MNLFINKLSAAVQESQVTGLMDQARNAIGTVQALREWLHTELPSLPTMGFEDTYTQEYSDDRGTTQIGEYYAFAGLWTVLATALSSNKVTKAGVSALVAETPLVNVLPEGWVNTVFNTLFELDILNEEYEVYDEVIKGMKKTHHLYTLTTSFEDKLKAIVEELRAKAHYKCAPLNDRPADWLPDGSGIHADANLRFSKVEQTSPAVLGAVNKLQSVAFKIDPVIAKHCIYIKSSARATDDEARQAMTAEATEILRISKQPRLHFAITADSRGRLNYRGGLVTPQGSKLCKAALRFADELPLGKVGVKALKVYTANEWGLDKASITKRIEWFDANLDMLMSVNTPQKAPSLIAYVCAKEVQYTQMKEDALSGLVIHQDGTCNGIQHTAAILRDKHTAATVNLTPTTVDDEPADIYSDVADHVITKVEGEHLDSVHLDFMKKYYRDSVKNAVMISGYGAGKRTIMGNFIEYAVERGMNPTYAKKLAEIVYNAVGVVAPAISVLTEFLKANANMAMATGTQSFRWTTPDGFEVVQKYRQRETTRIRCGAFTANIKGIEQPMDEIKMAGALAPNFVHSMDATHLRMVVNKAECDLVTIHDSIGSHACNVDHVADVIRCGFVALYIHNNPTKDLCERNDFVYNHDLFIGDLSISDVLQSSYFFS